MLQLSEALRQFDTAYLTKAKNELIHIIPGDPTFTSHVGAIMRALLQHELGLRRAAEQSGVDARPGDVHTDEPQPPKEADDLEKPAARPYQKAAAKTAQAL
jgi:hypothetical protein